MIWLYRLLIVPPVVLALPVLALFQRKIRLGLQLRLKPLSKFYFERPPIWIHAASGEFEYAKSVIRQLKSEDPSRPIVVSYFSPSFVKAIQTFEGVDLSFPLPLDLPGPLATLMARLKPQMLLIARTDLWPELLTQARRFHIPVFIFSYTQKDTGGNSFSRLLRRWLLGLCTHIFCVSQRDSDNLKVLGVETSVSVLGDTRYDQVAFRLANPKPLPLQLKPARTTLVAGSTWPADEAILIPALEGLLKQARMQLILVPHEPSEPHLLSIENRLQAFGLSSARFSHGLPWADKHVLIVDQVGVLAELYLWCDLAFVGGSFKGSVHSVMEALGASCRTFVGPFHQNNREAMEFQRLSLSGWPLVTVVQSEAQLRTQVEDALGAPAKLETFKKELSREFSSRLGASQALSRILPKSVSGPQSESRARI